MVCWMKLLLLGMLDHLLKDAYLREAFEKKTYIIYCKNICIRLLCVVIGGFTSWAGGITKQLSLTQLKQELILPTKNLTIKQATRHQKSLGFVSWRRLRLHKVQQKMQHTIPNNLGTCDVGHSSCHVSPQIFAEKKGPESLVFNWELLRESMHCCF